MRLRFALLTGLLTYLLLMGGTFNGILDPSLRQTSVWVLAGVALALTALTWRQGGWAKTPLDAGIALWLIAALLALAANGDAWRRIALGLWYVGLYVWLWYAVSASLNARVLRPSLIVDALLFAGMVVMLFGYVQLINAARAGAELPRPVSSLGNANSLAGLLVIILPLAAARAFGRRWRALYALYSLAVLALLLLTFSRGAWIGAAAGALTLAALHVERWRALPHRKLIGAALVIAGLIGGLVLVYTFTLPGRTLDLRAYVFEAGVSAFGARPIFGQGQFTFGAALARYASLPPYEPHAHAHNLLLNTAVELGLVGLAALGVLVALGVRAVWQQRRDHALDAGLLAAAVGAGMHHLFDLTSMMPALAVVLVLVLASLFAPNARRAGRRLPAAVLPLLLIAAALWESQHYGSYIAVMQRAGDDYAAAVAGLQPLIDADPNNAVYHYQQGMLAGLAALTGDEGAADQAIRAFERFTQLEPTYSMGWSNLAALYAQSGQFAQAVEAAQQAVTLGRYEATYAYNLGVYAEALGDDARARAAYAKALELGQDIADSPTWCDSPLRCGLNIPPSNGARVVDALKAGETVATPWMDGDLTVRQSILELLMALLRGDVQSAEELLSHARRIALTTHEFQWVAAGEAALAAHNGDVSAADRLEAALRLDPFEADWARGTNLFYTQWLHLALPRLYLPQVNYPLADGLLARWLSS